jgi:hypothetical protein
MVYVVRGLYILSRSWVLYSLDATILLVFKIPFIGNSSFSFLVPHTTCFGLAGHPQVCLIRFAAPPAMLWSASASGFGRGVFICNV